MAVSFVLASCSMGSGSGGTVSTASGKGGKNCMRVGILMPETTSTRWETDDKPLLKTAISSAIPGVKLDYDNAQGDSVAQFNEAKQDLAKGDCILVVAPHDSVVAANIVEAAKAQDVPVIAYDRLIQSKDLNYYVSFDNVKVGELQADYITKNAQTAADGYVNIAMISGSQTDANALLFSIGVHDVLDPLLASGSYRKISETFTPNWSVSSALSEATTTLTDDARANNGNDNIQVFYVANDDMAGSVVAALKTAGIKNVIITGQDATATGINRILAGTQSMTVYKPIKQEAASVGLLVQAIHDGTNTQPLTAGKVTATYDDGNIPSILDDPISVNIGNIESTVINDGFLKKQDVCTGIAPGTGGVC